MTNRRQFLKIGLASSALPLAASTASGSPLATFAFGQQGAEIPFYKVIVDERYPESIAFGEAMNSKGFDSFNMKNGDLTQFWYEELHAIWEKQPVAIAGLTKFGPLFCLEELGKTYGARVVYRGEHLYKSDGLVVHKLNGPEKMISKCEKIINFDNSVIAGETAAQLVLSCEAGQTAIVDSEYSERANHQSLLVDALPEDNLISWIVAPAQLS